MKREEMEEQNYSAYCAPLGLIEAPEAHFGFLIEDAKYRAITPIIGKDHVSLMLTAKNVPYSFIMQPYKDSFEWAQGVAEWTLFCSQWNLVYKPLDEGTGWHNPEQTHCIEFTRDPEVWAHSKMKTYAQLNTQLIACEKKMLRDLQ